MLGKMVETALAQQFLSTAEAEHKLHESQNGFRPRRGTRDNTWLLSELVQWHRDTRPPRPVFAAFVDIKKAYDTVSIARLSGALLTAGFNGKLVATAIAFCRRKVQVKLGGQLSEPYVAEKGVPQGAPCRPSCTYCFRSG